MANTFRPYYWAIEIATKRRRGWAERTFGKEQLKIWEKELEEWRTEVTRL